MPSKLLDKFNTQYEGVRAAKVWNLDDCNAMTAQLQTLQMSFRIKIIKPKRNRNPAGYLLLLLNET